MIGFLDSLVFSISATERSCLRTARWKTAVALLVMFIVCRVPSNRRIRLRSWWRSVAAARISWPDCLYCGVQPRRQQPCSFFCMHVCIHGYTGSNLNIMRCQAVKIWPPRSEDKLLLLANFLYSDRHPILTRYAAILSFQVFRRHYAFQPRWPCSFTHLANCLGSTDP